MRTVSSSALGSSQSRFGFWVMCTEGDVGLVQKGSCIVEVSGASTGEGWPVLFRTQRYTCAPEKLLTAVVVGSSSPVPVTNHQQVFDHVVFPIVKKLKGTQTP